VSLRAAVSSETRAAWQSQATSKRVLGSELRLLRSLRSLAMTHNRNMANKQYCIYILTNSRRTVLYTGVTNNLERRFSEHKSKLGSAFTKKYNVDQLVYYECGDDINTAIAREKQIKAGSRQDKIDLINNMNSEWKDLSKEFLQ